MRAATPPPAPVPTPVEEVVTPVEAPPPDIPLAQPEVAFAARAAARGPEPERPYPASRRAIFFDVENTSRVQHIARVIDHLSVDRLGRRTDFVAVGNWRVIGHDTARLLAGHGAQLLHSAPSVGVKDWSDLRIAVAAGVWLGTARPGDILEIITDDRAFDAVGDVATGLGIAFRRLSYRGLTGQPRDAMPLTAVEVEPRVESHGGRRRRGRRGGYGRREAPPVVQAAPPPAARPVLVASPPPAAEPHTAPHEELLGVARDLIQASSSNMVTLDSLANALKARGFSRPPGSPRLITRLRRIRELSVSRAGHITLVDSQAPAPAAPAVEERQPEPIEATPPAAETPPVAEAPPPSSGTAALDDRTFEERRADVEAALRAGQIKSRPPDSGGGPPPRQDTRQDTRQDGRDPEQQRRRSRRGGRRRRHHGAPAR